jgi:hypothetical protein
LHNIAAKRRQSRAQLGITRPKVAALGDLPISIVSIAGLAKPQ